MLIMHVCMYIYMYELHAVRLMATVLSLQSSTLYMYRCMYLVCTCTCTMHRYTCADIYIYIWDSSRQNEPSYIYIKCYKIPLCLNRYNF